MMKQRFKRFKIKRIFAYFALAALCGISLTSCTPSYPKEKLPEAVKTVCKDEYNMEVEVTVLGSTIGIYYPMKGLLDAGLGISGKAWDEISDLLLVASRVVLSTDADIQFYCIVAQDAKLPELQVVIIKYVDDVKRGMVRNISRNESFKRTLFSINLTPQAEKERSVEKVFNRLGVEDEVRAKVLDEFFKSPPTKLSDVGYWKGDFYLKEITLEEFLAEQIANRIKTDFRTEEDLTKSFRYISAETLFLPESEKGSFFVKFKIADQEAEKKPKELLKKKLEEIIRVTNEVVSGYKFENFDFLVIEDQMDNKRFTVPIEDIYNVRRKELLLEDIMQ
ncbi:MAG: hypothetical protein ABH862_04465 [Candidatus Omnitrophota bacterium]